MCSRLMILVVFPNIFLQVDPKESPSVMVKLHWINNNLSAMLSQNKPRNYIITTDILVVMTQLQQQEAVD